MHRLLYRQGKTLDEARSAIEALAKELPESASDAALMNGGGIRAGREGGGLGQS